MKSVIFAAVTVVILAAFVVFNALFVSYNIKEVISAIESADASESEYSKIYKLYERHEKYLSLTNYSEALDAVNEGFFEIKEAIKRGDSFDIEAKKSRLIDALGRIRQLSGINFDSIF